MMGQIDVRQVHRLITLAAVVFLCCLAMAGQGQARQLEIAAVWSGDYPVASLHLLPEGQQDGPVGYISTAETFVLLWQSFKPEQPVPEVDFTTSIVIFVRNTKYYNNIRIGAVTLENGIAEVIAMETMSARPIEDRAAMSLAVVPRMGIYLIRAGEYRVELR